MIPVSRPVTACPHWPPLPGTTPRPRAVSSRTYRSWGGCWRPPHEHSNHGQQPGVIPDDVGAALGLFEDMREELDRLETQVVIEARRRGMDWRQIAVHQGLNSSQAASQRYQRLMTRLEEIRQGVR